MDENPYKSPQPFPVLPGNEPDTRLWFMQPFHPATLAIALAAPVAVVLSLIVHALWPR